MQHNHLNILSAFSSLFNFFLGARCNHHYARQLWQETQMNSLSTLMVALAFYPIFLILQTIIMTMFKGMEWILHNNLYLVYFIVMYFCIAQLGSLIPIPMPYYKFLGKKMPLDQLVYTGEPGEGCYRMFLTMCGRLCSAGLCQYCVHAGQSLVKGINCRGHQVELYLLQQSFVLPEDPADHDAACSDAHSVPGPLPWLYCSLVSI